MNQINPIRPDSNFETKPISVEKEITSSEKVEQEPESLQASKLEKVREVYEAIIDKIILLLRKYTWERVADAVGTFLLEPVATLKVECTAPLSLKRHFNYYNLNPSSITAEQAKMSPIILLHGQTLTQASWLDFAKKIQSSQLGPVYTVSLPMATRVGKADFDILEKKIAEIKAQYGEHRVKDVKVDLVGHSRGADVAQEFAWQDFRARAGTVGKVISVGCPLDPSMADVDAAFTEHLYDLVATKDILQPDPSPLPTDHQATVKSGHLGLLYSPEAQARVIKWLKSE